MTSSPPTPPEGPPDDVTAPEDYPGEVIKEELWRNIDGNELSDKPANVADKIMAALTAAGYVVLRAAAGVEGKPYTSLVLGWDGQQWAYATPVRWHHDDGSRIVPAKELLGDPPGLDDPLRPPRCDHTFGG